MAIKILTDSSADLLPEEAEALGIRVLPMTVSFGGESLRDGIDITHDEFYNRLVECDELPKTSQIGPSEFEDAFAELLCSEEDEVLAIVVSSKLSGTYQSATIAAERFGGRVRILDSENACVGQGVLVRYAAQLLSEGLGMEELFSELVSARSRVRLLALLDTLEYLKKGGRVSSLVAIAGGILGIKPVVAIENGEVAVLGKARGSKQGNNLLMQLIEKSGGVDFDKPIALGYSGLSDAMLRKYVEDSRALWEGHREDLHVSSIGSTIGTHAGPGAIAVSFISKK